MKQLMKTIGLLTALVIPLTSNAQITLSHTYDSAGYYGALGSRQSLLIVELESEGRKFCFIDSHNKKLKLYELDHSLWRTISFSLATDLSDVNNVQSIKYISQYLFDQDDEIEFMYVDQNIPDCVTQIVNEDGSILFTANNRAPILHASVPQFQVPIYNTEVGTFMLLSGCNSDGKAYVYNLPGILATGMSLGPIHELATLSAGMAYPNPTANTTRIDYALPTGVNEGFIVLYTTGGQEVKRFRVDRTFNTLEITTDDLQSGTYYYNLQTTQGVSGGNRLVTVR
jgi:hypothetical protein